MQETVADRRSLPLWVAHPRRPRGRRSEGSLWRRGNGVGLREEQRGWLSSGAPSPLHAGWLSSGSRGLPSSLRRRRALRRPCLRPGPAHLPRTPSGRGERAPPRRARCHLAGYRTVVTATGSRLAVSGWGSLAQEMQEEGGGSGAGLRGPCRGSEVVRALRAHSTGSGQGGSLAGIVKIQTKPRMDGHPVNESAKGGHLPQLPYSSPKKPRL